jgi:hypothetical protein
LFLFGCSQAKSSDPRLEPAREVVRDVLSYYSLVDGKNYPVDADDVKIHFIGLPDRPGHWYMRGLVPWPDVILLYEEFPNPPWHPSRVEIIAHETIHLMQISEVGAGNWALYYLFNADKAEAEAYRKAAIYVQSLELGKP